MLLGWFAEEVGAEFDFCPVHTLCEVHADRPEGLVSVVKEMSLDDKQACERGKGGLTHSLA